MMVKKRNVLHIINEIGLGGAEVLLMESLDIFASKEFACDLTVLIERDLSNLLPTIRNKKKYNTSTINKNNYYDPFLIFKLIPYIRKYNIVHVHLFPSLYWVVLAKIISFSKVKLVFTEHSTNNKRMGNSIFSAVDKLFYSFYSKIITISDDVDKSIKKHLALPHPKFELIYNGINLKKIREAIPYNVEDFFPKSPIDVKVVMMVAGFKKPKDHITLIKAIAQLPNKVKLLLAGDGATRKEAENLVEKLELQERVKFLGARKDVPNLLKTADIVVLSSKYEGLSLASVEGLASGRPFIASEVPGLIDVVKGAGVLFPYGDVDKLASVIEELIEDKDYYNKVVSRSVERAKIYDIEQMIDKEIALYKTLL